MLIFGAYIEHAKICDFNSIVIMNFEKLSNYLIMGLKNGTCQQNIAILFKFRSDAKR